MRSVAYHQVAVEVMHGYAVIIYQVCDLDKKQRLFEAVIFLERITGDKTKTVDNCFCCSKSTKQGAEGASLRATHSNYATVAARSDNPEGYEPFQIKISYRGVEQLGSSSGS